MFDFFRKKKELRIPVPPSADRLPSFPTPKHLEKLSPEEIEKSADVKESLEEHKKRIAEKEQLDLSELREHHTTKPIFVHAPTYKALLDEIGQMKVLMEDADDIVETLERFKGDKDKFYKDWESTIKNIHEKLIYVDETLFKR